jgi:PadR family transcriptional regulator, regulatory protein PadR
MSKEFLGEFEELVLTMVGILGDEAYGNAIVSEIKTRVNRDANLSAVHVTLYRLEDKGYVKSSMGGART